MSATIIRVYPYNRLANNMIQLMFAVAVQRSARAPVVIEGYDLPDWQLKKPVSFPGLQCDFPVGHNLTRASTVVSAINRYRPKQIDLLTAIFRVGNLLPKVEYQNLFPLGDDEGVSIGADQLLIHIRGGDVANYWHRLYGPLPIGYYRYLVEKTGLRPVFIGEIDASPYCEMLRRAFPSATFISGGSARHDFQTIRRAHHIALGVSTFSWVASYLSDAQAIHVPIAGMFDPREWPEADLLPVEDPRYRYHDIPVPAWRNRYSDNGAELAAFHPLSSSAVNRRRRVAMLKSIVRFARIRLGMEERLARNAIADGKRRLMTPKETHRLN